MYAEADRHGREEEVGLETHGTPSNMDPMRIPTAIPSAEACDTAAPKKTWSRATTRTPAMERSTPIRNPAA